MLKAIGWVIKLSLFSIAILLAGDWVRWDGKSLAQHVRFGFVHAGSSGTAHYLRAMTKKITDDARAGFSKTTKERSASRQQLASAETSSTDTTSDITDRTEMQAAAPANNKVQSEEQIPSSERQKLKALIRQLNSSHD